ncbi:MAG: hypothetical protein IKO93_02100 [Lentisphaeria bacterium]|nr:hypothetical protein [Lentisphaeria bacterium]
MKKQLITYSLCGVIILGFAAKALWFFLEVQRKQDMANLAHNFRLVYTRLENYNKKNGSYPPQQDMRSLLKTLRLSDGDLFKVSIDIGSAVYHAPKQKNEDPVLTIQIKPHLFRKNYEQIVMQKNDGVIQGYIADSSTK